LKKLIDDIINHNNAIADFIDRTSELYQDGGEVIPLFIEKLNQSQFNSALANNFADLLQHSDDKGVDQQYSFDDIGRLYTSLLNLQDSNLATYADAAYFEFAVLNNAEKAKEIANAGLAKAKQKVDELQRILDLIKK